MQYQKLITFILYGNWIFICYAFAQPGFNGTPFLKKVPFLFRKKLP
jgi:hypothetical protein